MRSDRLVLMPGLDGTGRLFEPALPHLGESRCAVVRYPTNARTLDDHLAAVPLPNEPFVVVAESFSGPLAISLAARKPPQLRALVLIATFARVPFKPMVSALARLSWTIGMTPKRVTRRVLLGRHAEPAISSLLDDTLSSVPAATFGARLSLLSSLDLEAAKVQVPVLVIEATEDLLVPRATTRALATALGAELATIQGPHLVLQRSPAAVASAIVTFLERH